MDIDIKYVWRYRYIKERNRHYSFCQTREKGSTRKNIMGIFLGKRRRGTLFKLQYLIILEPQE